MGEIPVRWRVPGGKGQIPSVPHVIKSFSRTRGYPKERTFEAGGGEREGGGCHEPLLYGIVRVDDKERRRGREGERLNEEEGGVPREEGRDTRTRMGYSFQKRAAAPPGRTGISPALNVRKLPE